MTAAAERLRLVVHEFLRSESEEAELREALGDAAPAISEQSRSRTEVDRMAAALADMLDAHLERLKARKAT